MLLRNALLWTALAVAAIPGRPAPALAQDSACTYAACALRLRSGFMATSVVAGAAEIKASRSGFGGLTIPAFAAAGDSARYYYGQYRRSAPRARVLGMVAGMASVTGFFVSGSKHPTASAVLVSTSMVGGLLAALQGARASNQLQRAIWHYNLGVTGMRPLAYVAASSSTSLTLRASASGANGFCR